MEPIYYILIAISVSITLYILGRHWYRNYMRVKEAREYREASQLISGYWGKYARPKEVIKERPGSDRIYAIKLSPGFMEDTELLKDDWEHEDTPETNFGGGSFGGGGAEGTWVDSPSVDCGGDVGGGD